MTCHKKVSCLAVAVAHFVGQSTADHKGKGLNLASEYCNQENYWNRVLALKAYKLTR